MSEFFVGQKVVCVDDSGSFPNGKPVHRGSVYTIRWAGFFVGSNYSGPCVRVVGVDRPNARLHGLPCPDMPIAHWRFKPLEETSKTIEQFREIARGVSNGKPIIEDAEWRMPTPEKVKA